MWGAKKNVQAKSLAINDKNHCVQVTSKTARGKPNDPQVAQQVIEITLHWRQVNRENKAHI